MTDDASPEDAGDEVGGQAAPARATSTFTIRKVSPPTAAERQVRRDAMERAIRFGAAPYRDAEGKARYVFFRDANNAPVEAWQRDREAKRGYRRTQYARKAAGQMAWHPEDQIELAKRLGVIYHREGRSAEGAAERGLYDAIWRYEHVFDSFTVPRRFGREIVETGRVAAVAEEEARKLPAEDPRAIGGFWVRDRKNNGLIYVVPNPEPALKTAGAAATFSSGIATAADDALAGGGRVDVPFGQADAASEPGSTMADNGEPSTEASTESAEGQEQKPALTYPEIPLLLLEPTRHAVKKAASDDGESPVINMEKDRINNILAGEPARFEIADSPAASGDEPSHAEHSYGYWAVWIHDDIIEYEAKRQGVDPDLVRAIVYVENAQGWYGHPLEAIHVAKTVFPMNINPKTWARLVGIYADFYDPFVNVRAGVMLIRRLQERIVNPTVAKVASPFKFTGRELVSDYGARVAKVYATRTWEREPKVEDVYPEMDKPSDWEPQLRGYKQRREELQKRLRQMQASPHIPGEYFWGDASP